MAEDELLEVTPANLRLRKRILNSEERLKERKRREKIIAG
jgi:GTP-binding protein